MKQRRSLVLASIWLASMMSVGQGCSTSSGGAQQPGREPRVALSVRPDHAQAGSTVALKLRPQGTDPRRFSKATVAILQLRSDVGGSWRSRYILERLPSPSPVLPFGRGIVHLDATGGNARDRVMLPRRLEPGRYRLVKPYVVSYRPHAEKDGRSRAIVEVVASP